MRNAVPVHGTRRRLTSLHWHEHERAILGVLSVGGFFLLWEVVVRLGNSQSPFVVAPSEVLAAGAREVQTPRFWQDAWVSLIEFSIGYAAAILLGIPMGIVIGWNRRLSHLLEPIVTFLYAVPRITLLPVIVLWLGLTIWSKVAVVFLGAWVTILLNTFLGVRTADRRLVAVATVFGASQRKLLTSVVLPGSVPFILAGLRLGAGRALTGVIVGELYAASAGLGFMITVASNNLQVDRVLFGTFLFILVGVLTVESIRRVERRFAAWRDDLSVAA
jgi:NitT/TauT family transport system permease protein